MTPPNPPIAAASSTHRVTPPRVAETGRPAPRIPATDGERLMRFRQHRDETAFHEVVRAHAPLVWGICWQVLRHREDVEDAFQATFLILARKASSIRAADSAAGWLYRVAFRTALAARQRRRRLGIEPLVDDPPGPLEDQLAAIARSEQCEKLLEELHALAARYRQPLVLCYLEGRSRQEAADELGLTVASVKGRLARGLRLLRTRLAHRGLALSSAAALLAHEMATAQASVALAPVAQAAALAGSFAWAAPTVGAQGSAAAGAGSAAITLAKKGLLAMKIAAAAKPAIGLLAVGMTAGALALASPEEPTGGGRAPAAIVELVASFDDDAAADADVLDSNTIVAPGIPEPVPTAEAPATLALAGAARPPVPTDAAVPLDEPLRDGGRSADDAFAQPVPQDVLVAADPADEVANPQPVRVPYPQPQPQVVPLTAQASMIAVPAPSSASPDVLKLERDYWKLKGAALRRKAEAMHMRVRGLERPGVATQSEALEAQAEAELTEAEAILCQARAKQIEEALEAPRLSIAPTTQPAYSPPATATSTYSAPVITAPTSAAVQPQAAWPTGQTYSNVRTTPPAAAQQIAPPQLFSDPAPDSVEQGAAELREMAAQLKEQFAELQKQNEQLRRELDALRQQHVEPAPTER